MNSKAFPGLVLGIVTLLALGSTWMLVRAYQTRSAPAQLTPALADGPRVPDFSFTDQHGSTITASQLDGHYTVLDFMFTNCPLWCPGMTRAMAEVQNASAGSSLRFMSISIDGDHDTPERLAQWAADYGADQNRWSFLTAPPSNVWPIVGALGFDVSFDEQMTLNRPDGTTMANINHPTRLLLIGPDRTVIGMYSYQHAEELESLIETASELAP